MGRYAAGDSPAADSIVASAISGIGKEIEALRPAALRGVVLGGGYARGEGGVFTDKTTGAVSLYNDLDFFVVVESSATKEQLAAISSALGDISRRWSAQLGIDVDFCAPKTAWRIKHDERRLMIQELLHGYVDVALERGETLFAGVERLESTQLPWMEAARLLVNRGAGLLLAAEAHDAGFIARNINKAVLGAGDARLIAHNAYAWKGAERAARIAEPIYNRALQWKFAPTTESICDAAMARRFWLAAYYEVLASAPKEESRRSLFNAARWLVRRRSLGQCATFGLDPICRILRAMREAIASGAAFPAHLRRDWEVFN